MPAMGITPQRPLNHERQAIEAPAHVGVAGRQPDPRPIRHRDHRRYLTFASAFISAVTVGAATAPVIRIRPPAANSISITPALSATGGPKADSGSGVMATGLNAAGTWDRSQSCWRQRNNWLTWIPAARATSEATAPGSMAAVTIRSFSDRDQLRRRCTDVITSTCVFVIGVVLGLLLGLATITQLRKAVLTGCLPASGIAAFSLAGPTSGDISARPENQPLSVTWTLGGPFTAAAARYARLVFENR